MWYKRWISLAAGLCILCGLGGGMFSFAMDAADGVTYPGLDVSEYQGDIDFEKVAADGYQAVCIRAGWGDGNADVRSVRNYEKAGAAGLKTGFYYYVTAQDTEEATAQAEAFAKMLKGKNYTMRPAMDYEEFDGLTEEEVREIGLAFLETLENETGVIPMVYSDAYDAQTVWDGRFGAYPLWLADYEGGTPPDNPVWAEWSAYQYTDKGMVSGIEDVCDLDYFTSAAFFRTDGSPKTGDIENAETVHYAGYIVQPGDTMETVAAQFEVNADLAARYNGLTRHSALTPGQLLMIPRMRDYTVQPGDTLESIGQQWDTSAYALAEYNHIVSDTALIPGRNIQIPQR